MDIVIWMACFSAGLFVWMLVERRKYRRIQHASVVAMGTICLSQCVTSSPPAGALLLGLAVGHFFPHSPRAFAQVYYSYHAAGRTLSGLWKREVSTEEQALEICSRYRRGDQVPIYFDPDRPENSFLEPNRSLTYQHLAAGLCCLSVIVTLALALWIWTHP